MDQCQLKQMARTDHVEKADHKVKQFSRKIFKWATLVRLRHPVFPCREVAEEKEEGRGASDAQPSEAAAAAGECFCSHLWRAEATAELAEGRLGPPSNGNVDDLVDVRDDH